MKKYLYICLLLLISVSIQAQEVNVKAWFDTTKILIGDQVHFNIEVSHPNDFNIEYPSFNDTLVSGIEILSSSGPDTISAANNNMLIKLEYLITSFDTGFYEIEPVFAESRSSSGVLRYYSDYTSLEVIRSDIAPADSTDVIFDIIGPRKAGITIMEVLPWVLLLLVLAISIMLAYRYFGKRKKKDDSEISKLPEEPIHIIALRDFDKLEKKELWQKSQHKLFYSELTDILRTYIDRRYNISSLEMTSSETLESLLDSGFNNKELYELLRNIFNRADLSKFAKYKAVDTENIESIAHARLFVKMTYMTQDEKKEDNPEKEEKEVSDE